LQQEVAELVLQIRPRTALNGVKDLVGLLQGVSLDGVEGLFAIPGSAIRGAETGHDHNGFRQWVCAGGNSVRRFW
jgi:hypothetical protein